MRSKQNIILFTEPSEFGWETPSKIGNLFLNRFCIDEDNACEVLGVHRLKMRIISRRYPNRLNPIHYFVGYDELEIDQLYKLMEIDEIDELYNLKIISDSIQEAAKLVTKYEFGEKLKKIHLVFAQNDDNMDDRLETIDEIISNWMHSMKIKSFMVTLLTMTRVDLVSEHRMNTLRKTPLEYMEYKESLLDREDFLHRYVDFIRNQKDGNSFLLLPNSLAINEDEAFEMVPLVTVNDDFDRFLDELKIGDEEEEEVTTVHFCELSVDEHKAGFRNDAFSSNLIA